MEEVLEMADFIYDPSLTTEEITQRLQGIWNAAGAGQLVFDGKDFKWYRDESMSEENVLDIEISRTLPLKHPTEDTEYAHIDLDYVTETIDGQTHISDVSMTDLYISMMKII